MKFFNKFFPFVFNTLHDLNDLMFSFLVILFWFWICFGFLLRLIYVYVLNLFWFLLNNLADIRHLELLLLEVNFLIFNLLDFMFKISSLNLNFIFKILNFKWFDFFHPIRFWISNSQNHRSSWRGLHWRLEKERTCINLLFFMNCLSWWWVF